MLKKTVEYDGKKWRIASVHGAPPLPGRPDYRWAWLVNVKKPGDQCRLSISSDVFDMVRA